ncbi:putative ring finger protein p8b7.23 [Acrodontium crateriforme]|uniref:Ring finger protein p8b7.23 n=1 Tax=Acrodontium crateriforme TaxID=150365 RepID=A0AAQ3M5S9_9PEZI|nr:putative ring finger protein p8b7.23 [Acrodontium crateriforme]
MTSQQAPSVSSKAAVNLSKSSSSQVSPAASQTQQFFAHDLGQRRASSGTKHAPAARNQQNSKPKHKPGKRFLRVLEDDDEQFAMQNPHGRRGQQNITHLMNFSLPPRPNAHQSHRHHHGAQRRGGRVNNTWSSGYHAVDKARYIHANYRFIVDPRSDYRAQAEDADIHLDWNNVLQVIASSTTQAASCPICLGEPTAPRMARCGHIFCLPCLIRYMHSEDGDGQPPEKKARWKKCPICWDSIYISETRPVRWYTGQEGGQPQIGGDVVLRLVKRKAKSTLAMPRESPPAVVKGDFIPWYFAAEVMDYSRVMKGSEEYMLQQYDEALAAVDQLEKEDELMFGEDAEWTGRAKRMIHEAKEKIMGIGNPPAQPIKPELAVESKKDDRPPIEYNTSEDDVPDMYLQKQASVLPTKNAGEGMSIDETPHGESSSGNDNAVPRTLAEMKAKQTEKPQPSEYLFYHALLHYYLSPLDIRILKTAFGSYSAFPSSILPRVERVSLGHVVDDELRKRVKYLAHLPYGCEVGFLECDWTDTVSPEVLAEFRPMLERRRKRHDEKEAREEKDRVRIEKAEERELAAVRRKRPSISNDAFSAQLLPPLGATAADAIAAITTNSSPPYPNRTTSGYTSLASPSTSPSISRTVWGTAAVTPASPDLYAQLPPDDSFREDDGWLQGWEKDLLDQRDQELLENIESLSLDKAAAVPKSGGVGAGKKGGKKGKKITLMSTNARRGA